MSGSTFVPRPFGTGTWGTYPWGVYPYRASLGAAGGVDLTASAGIHHIIHLAAAGGIDLDGATGLYRVQSFAATPEIGLQAALAANVTYVTFERGNLRLEADSVLRDTWDPAGAIACVPGGWIGTQCSDGAWLPFTPCEPGGWAKYPPNIQIMRSPAGTRR